MALFDELSNVWSMLMRRGPADVIAITWLETIATSPPRWDREEVRWELSFPTDDENIVRVPRALLGSDQATLATVNLSAIMRGVLARAKAPASTSTRPSMPDTVEMLTRKAPTTKSSWNAETRTPRGARVDFRRREAPQPH